MRRSAFIVLLLTLSVRLSAPAQDKPAADSKWEADMVKFEAADKKSPPKPGGIVFIGSSSIRLWKTDKAFPGLDVVNRGFGGSEIPDSTKFAPRILFPYRPAIVVFYAGDNDSAAGHSADRIAKDFEAFATALHKELPATRLLYLPIKPSISRLKLRDLQADANAQIAAWCGKNAGWAESVDLVTPVLGADGKPDPAVFQKDGLHLNDEGYRRWNAVLRPRLEALVKAKAP